MVNTKLIKTKMAQENVNQEYLAYKLKIAQPTLNLKINNNRSFTIEEMFDLADVLNIDSGELRQFFLA